MVHASVTDPPKLETMRIVTGCETPAHFVAAFHRFCDTRTCFIPSAETRPVGSRLAFSLRLADGTPMLRGTCIVKGAWTTSDNPFRRPGVQLAILQLTADSEALYEQMLAEKTMVKASGARRAPRSDMATVELPAAPVVVEPPALPTAAPDAPTLVARAGFDTSEQRTVQLAKGTVPPRTVPIAVARDATLPLVLPARLPARARDAAPDRRFWVACALGAALLVAAVVLVVAFVLA